MNKNSIYIDRKNALRYMGCRGAAPDEIIRILDAVENEVAEAMTPRFIYAVKSVNSLSGVISGNDIARHLSGCEYAAVFAATLGAGIDALIRKYQSYDVTSALAADASASAAIEAFCDEAEKAIAVATGKYLSTRYSPGYGDYPLECQSALLTAVDAGRKIGLYAGDSFMLTPSKSVTAIIGLSDTAIKDNKKSSCATCVMAESCEFRKDGLRCGY